MRELCIKVLFPPSTEFAGWISEQRGSALLIADPWFNKAIAWAMASAKLLGSAPPSKPVGQWLREECGDPPFRWYALRPALAEAHPDQAVDLFEWLAIKVVGGKLTYDLNTLNLIFKDNEPLFLSYSAVWKMIQDRFEVRDLPNKPLLQMLKVVNQVVDAAIARRNSAAADHQ